MVEGRSSTSPALPFVSHNYTPAHPHFPSRRIEMNRVVRGGSESDDN